MTKLLSRCRSMAVSLMTGRTGGASLLLIFELFVALSLSVSYYYQIRNYGVHGDNWNSRLFMVCSTSDYRLEGSEVLETWKGRLAGMVLAGSLYDHCIDQKALLAEKLATFNHLFGLYHACWLLLLFVTIICALRNSLLINLGIYAGLMYNFADDIGPHFFPWDLPAILFFTLAVILYQRRQLFLMSVAVCVGALFKETVVLCILLPFFSGYWKWPKKVFAFLAVAVIFLLGKKFLLTGLHLKTAVLSMADATTFSGLFNWSYPARNLGIVCTASFNHPLFANAGTLVAMLLLVGYKRFRPYTLLIWLFAAGEMMYGTVSEFRIFEEVLPLSWILLVGYWKDWNSSGKNLVPGESENLIDGPPARPDLPDTTWDVRGTGAALIVWAITLAAITAGVVGWGYGVLADDRSPVQQARTLKLLQSRATRGDSQAQLALGEHYLNGKWVPTNLNVACEWFRRADKQGRSDATLHLAQIFAGQKQYPAAIVYYYRMLALDTNSVGALNDLAWLRATAPDPRLRNGAEAVRLAERACQLTHRREAFLIGTLAAAYAEAGRFNDAVDAANLACTVALVGKQPSIAGGNVISLVRDQLSIALSNQKLLELYQSGRAYHETANPSP